MFSLGDHHANFFSICLAKKENVLLTVRSMTAAVGCVCGIIIGLAAAGITEF
jgi:hypothetical protein